MKFNAKLQLNYKVVVISFTYYDVLVSHSLTMSLLFLLGRYGRNGLISFLLQLRFSEQLQISGCLHPM